MKPTLLLVDDDADLREAIADLLAHAGWTVVDAEDGEAALAWLRGHALPAVILLDLKMPRCDGYEFRTRQLADPRLRAVPTVVFTADTSVDAMQGTLAGLPMIAKSAELDELLAVLQRARGW